MALTFMPRRSGRRKQSDQTLAIGLAMLFNWWRKRAEQANRQHVLSQHRRLAFERLEERCLPSAKPISVGAADLLLPDQPANALPTLAVSADNDQLRVSPSTFYDSSAVGYVCEAGLIQATEDSTQQAPLPDDQNVLTTQPEQNGPPQDNTPQDNPQGTPASGGGR